MFTVAEKAEQCNDNSATGAENQRLRRQRQVERIWRLGARVVFELIDELARHHDIADVDYRLTRYAALDPELLRAVGGDRFPHPPIHGVT
jgi:hypothetical protein